MQGQQCTPDKLRSRNRSQVRKLTTATRPAPPSHVMTNRCGKSGIHRAAKVSKLHKNKTLSKPSLFSSSKSLFLNQKKGTGEIFEINYETLTQTRDWLAYRDASRTHLGREPRPVDVPVSVILVGQVTNSRALTGLLPSSNRYASEASHHGNARGTSLPKQE